MRLRNETTSDRGFGLVELVIAIFLLALIAIAMLPLLFNGIGQSSVQARTATATRFLYSVVEQGRESAASAGGSTAWCTKINSLVASAPPTITATVATCSPDSTSLVTLTLTASSSSTPSQLASVTAKVYVP